MSSYSVDDIMERLDEIASALDRMGARQTQLEHKFLELYDLVAPSRGTIRPAPCPYLHYPFPSVYQPVPPYITWSMTYPPKPEDGAK